jgi:hypothetical protein
MRKQLMVVKKDRKNQVKTLIQFSVLSLLSIVVSHLYPTLTFLIFLLALIVLICFFNKNKKLRNYLIVFLFVYWPGCFYFYLHWFVQGVVDENVLLNTYEIPIVIKMNFESFAFWALRFSAVSSMNLPILNLEIDIDPSRQFLLETYYWVALFCEFFEFNFSLGITFY